MKVCKKCHSLKSLDDFHSCKRQGKQANCKSCRSAAAAYRYKNNHETRAKIRAGHYLYRYGVTYDEILALRERQNGKCALCLCELRGGMMEHVDHCHNTGIIRGILCSECNTGIGKLRDDPLLLRRAAEYLESATLPSFDVHKWLASA